MMPRAAHAVFAGMLALAVAAAPSRAEPERERVLYLTHAAGWKHDVLPLSQEVLKGIGDRSGVFSVTATDDVSALAPDSLRGYGAVVFYTTGELPLDEAEKAAFLNFVHSGHGFVGLHSATDTFYEWPDYLDVIGGYFNDHPWHQAVTVTVADPSNPLVAFLGPSFEIADEIYQISDFDARGSHVLLRLDPASVDMTKGTVRRRFYGWPLAWTRSYGNGRVFYTALGHDATVWRDPRYQKLLLNAVLWTLGKPLDDSR